jgi:pimeloyl-ACP methyl ester carboxylesterase
MSYTIHEENGFKYIQEGKGEVLLLLHGLFGSLSNWNDVIEGFKGRYTVVIPLLPIYEMPVKKAGIPELVKFVDSFIKFKKFNNVSLLGNSLGGHLGLVYTLQAQDSIRALVLTGSSGLYENSMGNSFPRRGNYEFVKEKVEYTFYDPSIATEELVNDVFETTKSIPTCLRMVAIARSAQRHNMAKDIVNIKIPTLLIWGLNDTITPPIVAHEFNRLIPKSKLYFIDKCSHVPMMEHPKHFNTLLSEFLSKHDRT